VSKSRLPSSDNNRLTAIWSPSDFEQAVRDAQAVVKAGQRSHHLTPVADSERALRIRPQLLSQSRFRKARIYDFLAVLLMLATMAALGCAVFFLSTPQAKAEPIDPVAVAYAAHYADAVCGTLDDFPNLNGILGLISAIRDDGLTSGQAGAAIGLSVAEACPRHEPLLQAFIARYGSVAV
jgi:hypothetical protein